MSDRWWDDAACKGEPLTTFFKDEVKRPVWTDALAICATCLVKDACLQDALETEIAHRFGVRGGKTPPQRREIAKQMRSEGLLPRRWKEPVTPWFHGTGTRSYQLCRRQSGDACQLCKNGHAEQKRRELLRVAV